MTWFKRYKWAITLGLAAGLVVDAAAYWITKSSGRGDTLPDINELRSLFPVRAAAGAPLFVILLPNVFLALLLVDSLFLFRPGALKPLKADATPFSSQWWLGDLVLASLAYGVCLMVALARLRGKPMPVWLVGWFYVLPAVGSGLLAALLLSLWCRVLRTNQGVRAAAFACMVLLFGIVPALCFVALWSGWRITALVRRQSTVGLNAFARWGAMAVLLVYGVAFFLPLVPGRTNEEVGGYTAYLDCFIFSLGGLRNGPLAAWEPFSDLYVSLRQDADFAFLALPWSANPALWMGIAFLISGRRLASASAAVLALLFGFSIKLACLGGKGGGPIIEATNSPAYYTWLASMAMLLVVALVGLALSGAEVGPLPVRPDPPQGGEGQRTREHESVGKNLAIGAAALGLLVFIVALALSGVNREREDREARVDQEKKKADKAIKKVPSPAPLLALDLGGGVKMELVLIRAGKFMMGSPETEKDRSNDETQHEVTISRAFYMGKFVVTQEQYEAVTGNNPSQFRGAKNPVETVSWEDAQEFCQKLSTKLPLTIPSPGGAEGKWMVQLPTEAQWEYACRAGTSTRFYSGDADSDLDAVGWYYGNSGGSTSPVGGKKPNAWGLYDMHGNVWQWCADLYGEYPMGSATDPEGAATGTQRVLRGGSLNVSAMNCRAANRYRYNPDRRNIHNGFRVVVVPSSRSP